LYAPASASNTKEKQQENEALARRFHMEIFRGRNYDVSNEILAPGFVLRNPALPPEFTHGPTGVKKFALVVADSSPEYEVSNHETISKKDMVLIRWRFTGILRQEMLGIQHSQKPMIITRFDLFRIRENSKIAEM
jgi:hypothetical protein